MVARRSNYHLLSPHELTELCLALGGDPTTTAALSKLGLLSLLQTRLTVVRQAHQQSPRDSEPGGSDQGLLSPRPTAIRSLRQDPSSHLRRAGPRPPNLRLPPSPPSRPPRSAAAGPRRAPSPRGAARRQRQQQRATHLTADTLEQLEQRFRREMRAEGERGRFVPNVALAPEVRTELLLGADQMGTVDQQLRWRTCKYQVLVSSLHSQCV